MVKKLVAGLFLLGASLSPVQAATYAAMDPYVEQVQKQFKFPQGLRYYSHEEKGVVLLLETYISAEDSSQAAARLQLYVINTENNKIYEVRDNPHSQAMVAIGDAYFDHLRIDSITQIRFTHVVGANCYDYLATWQGQYKMYRPKLLQKRNCA